MKKILFFDLDGTLLTDEKLVLEDNKIAIEKARENGIEVVICSGRQLNAVKKYRDLAGAGRYIICTNGAEIIDTENNDELFNCSIDNDTCKEVLGLVKNKDVYIRIDTRYARYISNIEYGLTEEIGFNKDELYKIIDENNILQISFGLKDENEIDDLIVNINSNPNVKIENKFYADYLPKDNRLWIINIINKSVSKGNAIAGLCKFLKMDINSEVVAFGDDKNDISMMETVKNSIAMENGDNLTKEKASKVIGNNNTNAIAQEIYRIIEDNKKDV